MKYIKYLPVFLLLVLNKSMFAQQTCGQSKMVVASGGTASNNLMITVGEAIVATQTGGLQLGYQTIKPYSECRSSIATLTEESVLSTISKIGVFPNPATDQISITGLDKDASYHYALFDYTGKLVMENIKPASASQTVVDISRLNATFYMLRLDNLTTSNTQTFKIIKTY